MAIVPYSDAAFDRAQQVAAAASGQYGPLQMLAAWLLIIGAVIVTSTIGVAATIVLVALMLPILALGVVWAVSTNLADQTVGGYSVKEITLVAGPVVAVALALMGSWPFGVLAIVATIIIVAA